MLNANKKNHMRSVNIERSWGPF